MAGYTTNHVTGDLYQLTISTKGIDLNAPASNIELAIFYIDRSGGILVDAAFENTAELVLEGVEELGGANHLVITHGHPDHIGGAAEIADTLTLETYVPSNEDSAIEAFDDKPDILYEDGDEFLGLEAIHCPGDTPGSYALLSLSDDALIGGDVINGSDFRQLPPGYLIPPPAVFADDLKQAEFSLEKLLDYEFSHALVTHGSNVHDDPYEKLNEFVNFPASPDK